MEADGLDWSVRAHELPFSIDFRLSFVTCIIFLVLLLTLSLTINSPFALTEANTPDGSFKWTLRAMSPRKRPQLIATITTTGLL